MQFYDGTNKNGICQKIDRLCDSTDTSYPRLDKTSEVNQAYEKVISWIINADGTWQFDDSNKSDQPRGTLTLVQGQEAYTFASDYLQIEAMDVKDVSGNWYRLKPLDHSDLGDQTPEQYFGTTAGTPQYFDLFTDDSFRLYPSPSSTYVTLTAGLRVWFKRAPTAFTATSATTDDSTTPGFASPFHEILAYMAAIPYCMKYHPQRVAAYLQVIGDTEPRATGMKAGLVKHYSMRDKATRKVMTTKTMNQRNPV